MMKVVLCNCPESSALPIAKDLIARRLAACVNLLSSVRSVYHWDGEVAEEVERPLLIKTSTSRIDELRDALVALHPYEVPEILVLDVDVALSHTPYVRWVVDESTAT
ncbi:MAG: divalent cation tolerance protein CutA [Myxococcota bacterium]|nr:divalent cation tolerance protein CutA [Myxococcota bacterium]